MSIREVMACQSESLVEHFLKGFAEIAELSTDLPTTVEVVEIEVVLSQETTRRM